MKRIISFILVICLFSMIAHVEVYAKETNLKVGVDGNILHFKYEPIYHDGRILAPIEELADALGLTYTVDVNTINVSDDNTVLSMELGVEEATINNISMQMDVACRRVGKTIYVPIRFLAETFRCNVAWDATHHKVVITTPNKLSKLPSIGSREDYIKTLNTFIVTKQDYKTYSVNDTIEQSSKEEAVESPSETNNQVNGVEEGDVVKTDGKYIYVLDGSNISIVGTEPTDNIRTVIELKGIDTIKELFIDDKRLVVVGNTYYEEIQKKPTTIEKIWNTFTSHEVPMYYKPKSFVKIYDLTDIRKPKLVNDYTFDGYYKSARVINHQFYMVTSRYIELYRNMLGYSDEFLDGLLLPSYEDSVTGNRNQMNYDEIKCLPECMQLNYMITIGLDLTNSQKQPDMNAYIGYADNIYVSKNKLYIAAAKYDNMSTTIYRFTLGAGKVTEAGIGKVPGRILNQFSMDEHNDYFRIATNSFNISNNVYILDYNLNTVGKLEGIAEGERIYSTRFVGDKLYMVTFKQMDPFFVIDMHNPTQPEILGELKIPGYSTYLHYMDENNVLGFGMDTEEVNGNVQTGGFKISLFDVSNIKEPIEKDLAVIGERGTHSELLYNHKALLYMGNQKLFGFPISEIKNDVNAYIGAYIYQVKENKLECIGRLRDLETCSIKRLLYIDKHIYAVSGDSITVYSLDGLKKTRVIYLK